MRLWTTLSAGIGLFLSASAKLVDLDNTDGPGIVFAPDSGTSKSIESAFTENNVCPAMSIQRSRQRRQDQLAAVDCIWDTFQGLFQTSTGMGLTLAAHGSTLTQSLGEVFDGVQPFTDPVLNQAFAQHFMEGVNIVFSAARDLSLNEIGWTFVAAMAFSYQHVYRHSTIMSKFKVQIKPKQQDSKFCFAKGDTNCDSRACASTDGKTCSQQSLFPGCQCFKRESKCKANPIGTYHCDQECGGKDTNIPGKPMDGSTGATDEFSEIFTCKGRNEGDDRKGCDCYVPRPGRPIWYKDALKETAGEVFFGVAAGLPEKGGNSGNNGNGKAECRRSNPDVKKDPKQFKFIEHNIPPGEIDKFCKKHLPNGLQNSAGRDPIEEILSKDDLNEFELKIEVESGATMKPEECKTNFEKIWKCEADDAPFSWGGTLKIDKIKFSMTPKKNRVPENSHDWNGIDVKVKNPDNWKDKPRLGRNGKPWDLQRVTECLHTLRRVEWGTITKREDGAGGFDCDGWFTYSMARPSGSLGYRYGSPYDCFMNTWESFLYEVIMNGAIQLYVWHKATVQVSCNVRIDPYDIAVLSPDDFGEHTKECFKSTEAVRNNPQLWKWTNRDKAQDKIQEFCGQKWPANEAWGSYEEGNWDAFHLHADYRGHDPPSEQECLAIMTDGLDGCDHHAILNQFNTKWGFKAEAKKSKTKYELLPQKQRVGSAAPNWECSTWKNREQKEFKGKNGKPLPEEVDDKMMKMQCLHALGNGDWPNFDCGDGLYNLYMWHQQYDSPSDCFNYNLPCATDSIMNQGGVELTAEHWAGSWGKWKNVGGSRCQIRFVY